MSGRKMATRKGKWPTLSAEDRAFLDFVALLAVEQALRERNGDSSEPTCGREQARRNSKNDGNT